MDFSNLTNIDIGILTAFGGHGSPFLDTLAVLLTSGWTWVPMYLVMFFVVIKNNETMAQILLVVGSALACVLFSGIFSDLLVKPFTMRLRPLNDPMMVGIANIVEGVGSNTYSFFSSHAANTFSICIFFSLLFRNVWCMAALVTWSLVNGWTRIYLSMHYPSDVAAGLVWGAMVGALVYYVQRRIYMNITPHLHFISSQYTRTGYALKDITMIICVMTLTVLLAVFLALLMRA